MILTTEIIKLNLETLEEVKKDFPILQDFQDGKIQQETVNNIGLDLFVSFINFIKSSNSAGMSLIYDKKITYREVKKKIVEQSYGEKPKSIFSKKKEEDLIKVFNDQSVNRRYTRTQNQSYCSGLEKSEPIILNYFIQKSIPFSEHFFRYNFYFKKLEKPKFYSRELKMTQQFIDLFIDYSKTQDFDLRKCNIKSLITELNSRLRPMMRIDTDLQVKCIRELKRFTVENTYQVLDSRINYYGFLEIKLQDDTGDINYVPYSNFEEISRQRSDIFKELGL